MSNAHSGEGEAMLAANNSASLSHDVEGQNVEVDGARRRMRREMRSRMLNMKCVNTICATLVVVKLAAITIVLSTFETHCNKPLLAWTSLVMLKSFFEVHFFYLMHRKVEGLTIAQEENFEEPPGMVKMRRGHEVVFLALFILGHIWYLADSNCAQETPELYTLVFFLLAIGYVQLAIPVFFVLFICLCMPIMLLFYVFFKTDLSPEAQDCIDSLPVKSYDPKKHHGSDECAICYDEFENHQKVIPLPCNKKHVFHDQCIKSWLSIKMQCPLCKTNIYDMFEENDMNWS